MKEKTFYSICRGKNKYEAVKHEGYKFEKFGMKFYVYQGESGRTHIIDPKTGLAVANTDLPMQDAASCLSDHTARALVQAKTTKKYQVQERMFKALKKAEKTREECEAILKGLDENGENKD